MFRGINAVNLDQKGRVAIPTRYRQPLKNQSQGAMVLTIDTEQKCLVLYPLSVWEEIEKKIAALPSFQPETRRIQRLLIGHATELNLDSHGRILIPPMLREYAHLSKKAVVIGQGNKFEVWDEELWQKGRETWLKDNLLTAEGIPEELRSISL